MKLYFAFSQTITASPSLSWPSYRRFRTNGTLPLRSIGLPVPTAGLPVPIIGLPVPTTGLPVPVPSGRATSVADVPLVHMPGLTVTITVLKAVAVSVKIPVVKQGPISPEG